MYFGRCTKFRFCSGGQSFSCCSNFFRAFSKIQEGMLLSLTGLKSSTVRILLTCLTNKHKEKNVESKCAQSSWKPQKVQCPPQA